MARTRTHPTRAPRESSSNRADHRPLRPAYRRSRDLPGLLPLLGWELARGGLVDQDRLVALLRRALRIERQRGLRGDWTYDLARHERLLQAYRHEARVLQQNRKWSQSTLAARS